MQQAVVFAGLEALTMGTDYTAHHACVVFLPVLQCSL